MKNLTILLLTFLVLFTGVIRAEKNIPIYGSFKGSNMEFSLRCAALYQLTTLAPDEIKPVQEVSEMRAQFMGALVEKNYKVARIPVTYKELKYERLRVVDSLYLGYPNNEISLFLTYERCEEFIQYLIQNIENFDDFGLTRIQPPERKSVSEERIVVLDTVFKAIMDNGKKLLIQLNFSKPSDIYKALDKTLGIKE